MTYSGERTARSERIESTNRIGLVLSSATAARQAVKEAKLGIAKANLGYALG